MKKKMFFLEIFTAEYFYVAVKMAADVDELDINPVYQALQVNITIITAYFDGNENCVRSVKKYFGNEDIFF